MTFSNLNSTEWFSTQEKFENVTWRFQINGHKKIHIWKRHVTFSNKWCNISTPFWRCGRSINGVVFASPQKRLRAYPGRGSDRKLEKCQNSTNKQNMNIVTLFMLNKKWSVLISNPEDQHVYFLCSRIPETRGRKRWRIPVESQPFCSSPKNSIRRFLGILTSFQQIEKQRKKEI